MDKFFALVGALSMVGLPVAFVINLCYEELWSDWQRDPRIYGTASILMLLPLLWLWARKYRKEQRAERRYSRLHSIVNVVERLYGSGRNQEAHEARRLYDRVYTARNEAEEIKLAKQFSETFGL